MVKSLPAHVGDIRDMGLVGKIPDMGLIPGLGRSLGGGHGNPLQYSCWKLPWTEEPGGLHSPWVSKESNTTEVTLHSHLYYFVHLYL